MAKGKKIKSSRKIRTPEHINADLSANYVERIALLKGFSVEQIRHDYGYDLILFTYDSNGEIENGQVFIQLKAKQKVEFIKNGEALSYSVDRRDLNFWKKEVFPVIFVVYDAQREVAYWLHIQDYLKNNPSVRDATTETPSVNIPSANLLNDTSMGNFAALKAAIQAKIEALFN